MKVILLGLALVPYLGFASEKAEIKICTVLHENKSSKCLTQEKQSFPTTKLMGISKIKKAQTIETLSHNWNGQPATEVTVLERGRILISTYQVPQGHTGVVAFTVTDSTGTALDTKTLEVARGPLSVSAHIKSTQVSQVVSPVVAAAPVVVPEVKKAVSKESHTEDLPSLDSMETEDTADALSAMAKEGGEVPDVTDESLNEAIEAVNAGEKKSSPKADVKSRDEVLAKEDTGLIWRRIEIHGAFVTQSKKGSSYTVIPYYAPEFRSESFFGFGARVGGTEWKQEKGKNISALEGDVHLSFSFRSDKSRFTLQPAYGYHSWSKYGSNGSYGGLFEIKMKDTALSIVGGVHLWTYKKVDYRLATIGLGVEF